MKYIASCSFGKDSLAMILKLLELNYPLDEVVYFDIGAEFESIYQNKERIKKELGKREIQFTELRPKQDFFYMMLEKEVHKRDGTIQHGYKWCGGMCRWGTTLKLNAIKENNKKFLFLLAVQNILFCTVFFCILFLFLLKQNNKLFC